MSQIKPRSQRDQAKNFEDSSSCQGNLDKGVQCQTGRTRVFSLGSYFFLDLTVVTVDTVDFPWDLYPMELFCRQASEEEVTVGCVWFISLLSLS